MARTLRLTDIALAIPEQRRVRLDFPRAGPFGPLGRPKDMIERLEENLSERQRLRRTTEYSGKRSEVHSKCLLTHKFGSVEIALLNKAKTKVACTHATLYIITPREFLLFEWLHVCIYVLHVIVLLEALNNLVNCSTLLLGNVLQVVRNTCELATCNLEAFLLECLLDCTE